MGINKIGTIEDFRHFAIDKAKMPASVVDSKVKDFVYPTVIEERPSAQRITEINVFSTLIKDRILFLNGEV